MVSPSFLTQQPLSSELRQEIAIEARSWVGTKYHRRSALKKIGVDCGMLPYAIYRKFNLVPEFTPDLLPDDWFSHTEQQKYLEMVQRYLQKLLEGRAYRNVEAPLGSLALVKVASRTTYTHSGIVVGWPRVVHATYRGVCEVDASLDPMWLAKEIIIFDPVIGG